MNDYLFRMPAGTPELTYAALTAWMDEHKKDWLLHAATGYYWEIGRTVTVTPASLPGELTPTRIDVRLYDVLIAKIYPHQVEFPVHHDTHQATTQWLAKIVVDNGIGGNAGRIRRQKSDPLIRGPRGYCGPLAVNWDRNKLIEGHTYPVDHDRIARNKDQRERWDAEMKFRRDHPATWDADLAATVPHGGMPDYRLDQPERAIEWGIRQEAATAERLTRRSS